MLPTIAFISAFLNNTPVVVIFAPIIKRWAESVKFLLPVSYTPFLCDDTGRNLYPDRDFYQSGGAWYDYWMPDMKALAMFELGKGGYFRRDWQAFFICSLFPQGLLPDVRTDAVKLDEEPEEHGDLHRVEAVLGARFPGINKKLGDFNFKRHYGAEVEGD